MKNLSKNKLFSGISRRNENFYQLPVNSFGIAIASFGQFYTAEPNYPENAQFKPIFASFSYS